MVQKYKRVFVDMIKYLDMGSLSLDYPSSRWALNGIACIRMRERKRKVL